MLRGGIRTAEVPCLRAKSQRPASQGAYVYVPDSGVRVSFCLEAHFKAPLREPAKLSERSKADAATREAPYLRSVAVAMAALDECSINFGD